jgi:hypothetical protein
MNQHLERLDGLAAFLRFPALKLIELCQVKLGRTLLVVHCWRSMQEQSALYQKGRAYDRAQGIWLIADPGLVVTNALPGRTAHTVVTTDGAPASLALDVIPLGDMGQPEWDVDVLFWDKLYELSWKVGLDPLGDVIGASLPGDKGHLEEPAWKLKLDGLGLRQPFIGTEV